MKANKLFTSRKVFAWFSTVDAMPYIFHQLKPDQYPPVPLHCPVCKCVTVSEGEMRPTGRLYCGLQVARIKHALAARGATEAQVAQALDAIANALRERKKRLNRPSIDRLTAARRYLAEWFAIRTRSAILMKRRNLTGLAEQIASALGLGWSVPKPQNEDRDNPEIRHADGYGIVDASRSDPA